MLFRLGLLAFVVMASTSLLLETTLPTLDVSAWYGFSIGTGLAIFFALSSYAFYRCVAWRGGIAEALVGD